MITENNIFAALFASGGSIVRGGSLKKQTLGNVAYHTVL